jgi:hypothetical protein
MPRKTIYRRFGAALEEFAAAVDIADKQVLDDVLGLLTTYLIDEVGLNFYEILLERWVVANDGPERVLGSIGEGEGRELSHIPIGDGNTSQTAYSFVRDRPLWITAHDQGLLKRNAVKQIDSWSDTPSRGLPPYKSGNSFDIKTSIVQPLRNRLGAFGVINVESEKHLVCNQWAKEELKLIAGGVSSIVGRYVSNEFARGETKRSTEYLKECLKTDRWNIIQKPKLFMASSDCAREDVINAMRKAVTQLDDYELAFWRERQGGGEVRQRMLSDLRESRVVVCYLSEPADEGGYEDNPNVLFEAGIADGLKCAWSDIALIPIREECSARKIPFDLNGFDMVLVPRLKNGTLNKREFSSRLLQQLKLY